LKEKAPSFGVVSGPTMVALSRVAITSTSRQSVAGPV